MLWVLVHQIFEAAVGDAYPILQHQFIGKTKADALRVYRAHLKTDEFLRGCEAVGRWKDVECRTKSAWYRYDPMSGELLDPKR